MVGSYRPKTGIPKVWIVTPSFNQAAFLEQTIESVLSQNGRGSEFQLCYAVVDGGSSDGSVDIIRRYKNELCYWCSERDRGQTHAINKGFDALRQRHKSADLCAYLNSDDYYLPDSLRRVIAAWSINRHADLFHGVCQKVDEHGGLVGEQLSDITDLPSIVDLWNHWLRPKRNHNFIQPEVFWTHRLSEQLGRFNEDLNYTMDFDYWLRAFDGGAKVHTINAALAAFRVHAAQKTTSRTACILELLDGIEPFVARRDPRILAEDRERILQHILMTRELLNSATSPEKQVLSLFTLAAKKPGLVQSRHYWRNLRRCGKRVLWRRPAA